MPGRTAYESEGNLIRLLKAGFAGTWQQKPAPAPRDTKHNETPMKTAFYRGVIAVADALRRFAGVRVEYPTS